MSDDQDIGVDATTSGPPRSYGRTENTSIISSSQLSPKSPARSTRRESRTERESWGEPGTERIDAKRRSTVAFGGKTSVAPSDSISKMNSKTGRTRTSFNYDGPGTEYSRRSRRRSAPWQEHDYRSTFPSKAGSSHGGTARSGGVPLTENNLDEFNEKQPPRSEAVSQRGIERQVSFEEIDRKSSRKSRRNNGVLTQKPQSRAGCIGADDRRSSKNYSRVERDDGQGDRTVVTTRRKTEVDEDGLDEEAETKSKSKYESYSRPTQSSASKTSARRQSRAADVYEHAQEKRYSSSSSGRQSRRPKTATRPPTMPTEHNANARSTREVATVVAGGAVGAAVATNAGSRPDARSKAPTQFFEEDNEIPTRQTEAKSERFSSRRTEARTRQTEVKSERYSSQQEVETERQSNISRTRAPSQPARPEPATAAGPATSSSSSPSSPMGAQSPIAPEDCQWERRVHVTTMMKPDGRLIRDREVCTRRIYPQQSPVVA